MNKTLLCLAVSSVLVGCSSSGVKISDGSRNIQSFKENKIEFPTWYLDLPKEENTIYVSATEVSSDLQFSLDKALMSANREIAFKLKNEVSQKYKEHTTESNFSKNDTMMKSNERLSISESNHVNIVGAQKVRTEVIREGNRYRAFVLVKYSLDESNQIHMNYISKTRKEKSDKVMNEYNTELKQLKMENE